MGDPYDADTMTAIKDQWKIIDSRTDECKGKMSHKAQGVESLKPFEACMPHVVREYKTKNKLYCASWATPNEMGQAPICVATQARARPQPTRGAGPARRCTPGA